MKIIKNVAIFRKKHKNYTAQNFHKSSLSFLHFRGKSKTKVAREENSVLQAKLPLTRICLVGNPNAGKTTIYNRLTRSNAHTGNWNGVTTSVATKVTQIASRQFLISDLPGIYSLNGHSIDERNAIDFIKRNRDVVYVNVIDCNTLEKSLHLCLQLIELGVRVVLMPNFIKKATRRGLKIDFEELARALGVGIIVPRSHLNIDSREFIYSIDNAKVVKQCQKKLTPLARKQKIDKILARVIITNSASTYGYSRLDSVFTSPCVGTLIFLITMFAIFWLTFGAVGSWLNDKIVDFWNWTADLIICGFTDIGSPEWLKNFIQEGVLNSIGGIIGFLPQICLLWLCLEFLEQSGYLARVVWLTENMLNRLGLSGKSALPLLLGFGCTTLALPTVESIGTQTARKKTASILCYLVCNAKLPVLLCVASVIFPQYAVLVVFCVYLLSIAVSIILLLVWQKICPTPVQNEIFEFTPLVLPNFWRLVSATLRSAINFLHKIWSVVLIFGILVWILSHLGFDLQPAQIENSILAQISKIIAPIFAPLGFEWGSVVSLCVGVVAKEMILSSIAVLNGATNITVSLCDPTAIVHFDFFSAIAFLVFCSLYTPCVSALSQLRTVLSRREFLGQIVMQFAVAFVVSLVAKSFARAFGVLNIWCVGCIVCIAVLLTVLAYRVLKRIFGCKNCGRGCNFCNRT